MQELFNVNGNMDERVITLKEILDVINADRKAKGENPLEHNKAMVKVENLSKEPSFGQVAKMSTHQNMPNGGVKELVTYHLTKKQALAVGARLDNSRLMFVIDKLEELSKPQEYDMDEIMLYNAQRLVALRKEQQQLKADMVEVKEKVHELDVTRNKTVLPKAGYASIGELAVRVGLSTTVVKLIIAEINPKTCNAMKQLPDGSVKPYTAYKSKPVVKFANRVKTSAKPIGKGVFFKSPLLGAKKFQISN